MADAENLAWRLAWVLRNGAPHAWLDAYDTERRPAALENLAATDATMRFMAPHGLLRRAWRRVVLGMAPRSAWFRRRVNSGRLAEPVSYAARGPDDPRLPRHGSVAPDLSLPSGGRLRERLGADFVVLAPRPIDVRLPLVVFGTGTVYGDERAWLVRPDGYLTDSRPLSRASELVAGLQQTDRAQPQ